MLRSGGHPKNCHSGLVTNVCLPISQIASEVLYASGYDASALDQWAERVVAWATGGEADGQHASAIPALKSERRDVYVYFDNDAKERAPFDAQGLMERVKKARDQRTAISQHMSDSVPSRTSATH